MTALAYAGSREQLGRPNAGFQLTQVKLTDMTLEYGKAMLLALHLARLTDAGNLSAQKISLGKLNNVREEIASAARFWGPVASPWSTRR